MSPQMLTLARVDPSYIFVFTKKTWFLVGAASFAGTAVYVAYRLHEIAKRQRMLRV